MEKNQKCVVSGSAPFHSNRVGFFQFFGEGINAGCAILTEEELEPGNESGVYFIVKAEDIQPIGNDENS